MDVIYIASYTCMEVISHLNLHTQFSYSYTKAKYVSLLEGAMH